MCSMCEPMSGVGETGDGGSIRDADKCWIKVKAMRVKQCGSCLRASDPLVKQEVGNFVVAGPVSPNRCPLPGGYSGRGWRGDSV